MKKSFVAVLALTLIAGFAAEAKTKGKRNVAQDAANVNKVYCGKMSLGSGGHDNVTTYTLVDEPKNHHGVYYNAVIPQDAEVAVDFSPAPGDSDPNGDNYRDHNVMIGKEKVWMEYAGNLMTDPKLTNGKCLCISGQVEKLDDGTNVLRVIQGYAFRDQAKCKGISDEAVARFARRQD